MDIDGLTAEFCSPNFDPNICASNAVSSNNVEEILNSVSDKIVSLDIAIHHHVADHHSDLLKKATDVDQIHNQLQSVQSKVTHLERSMEKLQLKINTPYDTLRTHVVQLRHLQTTCELLRKIVRSASLIKSVQTRFIDLAKSSLCINELEQIFSNTDWEGVHVLESIKRAADQCREDMTSQAWNLVNASFELSDQVQLGLGLQVFHHLNMLPDVLCQLISSWRNEFLELLGKAVDVEALTSRVRNRQSRDSASSGPGRAVGGQAAAFHYALWTSLDSIMDNVERIFSHFRLLALTLLKKRDATANCLTFGPILRIGQSVDPYLSLAELTVHGLLVNWSDSCWQEQRDLLLLLFATVNMSTQEYFSTYDTDQNKPEDSQRMDENLQEYTSKLQTNEGFIGWSMDQLASRLCQAMDQSLQIKEALEGEYPKLLKLVLDLMRRVRQTQVLHTAPTELTDPTMGIKADHIHTVPMCALRLLEPYERAYLSRSLSRLFDQVSMSFSSNTPSHIGPNKSELEEIVQRAVGELAYATVDHDLLNKVSRNVSKTVVLFCTKIESLVAVEPDAVQVTDLQTKSQQNNIHLVNLLCNFGTQLGLACNRRLRNLPVMVQHIEGSQSALDPVSESLRTRVNSLCISILQPLLQVFGESIEQLISTMHGESYIGEAEASVVDNSLSSKKSNYIKQLQDFVARAKRQYLSGLSKHPSTGSTTVAYDSLGMECFSCGQVALHQALRPFLSKWINVFVHNVSLVRPLSEFGRLRLAADCAEFELSIAPLLPPGIGSSLSMLAPDAYARLRAFRHILTADLDEITKHISDSTQQPIFDASIVPASLVCQHLFSRAPDEIRSPHDTAGWSINRYVSWLMTRSDESERLAFLRNGLIVYAREVDQRDQLEYDPMYLVLKSFLNPVQDVGVESSKSKDLLQPATRDNIPVKCA